MGASHKYSSFRVLVSWGVKPNGGALLFQNRHPLSLGFRVKGLGSTRRYERTWPTTRHPLQSISE